MHPLAGPVSHGERWERKSLLKMHSPVKSGEQSRLFCYLGLILSVDTDKCFFSFLDIYLYAGE